ncbi:MAG: ExbD/TolR family protein [Gammaproteobacteria bacterium]
MHFPERRPDQTEERILPLINVVFLLLIFFMITGNLSATDVISVTPPSSISAKNTTPEELILLVDAKGQLALNGDILLQEAMLTKVSIGLRKHPNTQLFIKTDSHLAANRLVKITQALNDVGVEKIQLLTLPE